MPRGGMSNEATHCTNFQSIGASTQVSLTSGKFLTVTIGDLHATIKCPVTLNAFVVVLGDNAASIKTESSSDLTFDEKSVAWH